MSDNGTAPFKQRDIRQLVAQASTLSERRRRGAATLEVSDDPRTTERLRHWQQVAARGEQDRFEKLLAAIGISVDSARSIVGSDQLLTEEHVPGWAKIAQEICRLYQSTGSQPHSSKEKPLPGFLSPAEPQPFEEVLAPIVSWASEQLITRLGKVQLPVSPPAYDQLLRILLRELCAQSSLVMNVEMVIYRQLHQTGFAKVLALMAPGRSTEL